MQIFDIYIRQLKWKWGENLAVELWVIAKDKETLIKKMEDKYKIKITEQKPAKCRNTLDYNMATIYLKWSIDLIWECLVKEKTCKQCKKVFSIFSSRQYHLLPTNISAQKDYLNDEEFYNEFFCSDYCRNNSTSLWVSSNNALDFWIPVIYKITNKETKQCYIWQTIQSFTLRWWQHLKTNNTEKFWKALSEYDITKWTFEVIEVIRKENLHRILEIETNYMKKYNSVDNGYNNNYSKII